MLEHRRATKKIQQAAIGAFFKGAQFMQYFYVASDALSVVFFGVRVALLRNSRDDSS